MNFVLATTNEGKIKEISDLFKDYTVFPMPNIGYEIDENGETFYENALIKARAVQSFLAKSESDRGERNDRGNKGDRGDKGSNDNGGNMGDVSIGNASNMNDVKNIILADDSGLVIDALGGKPGVRSADFLGYSTPFSVKNDGILQLLADVPMQNRTAHFVTVIVGLMPNGEIKTALGTLSGLISLEPKGVFGFGYDPIFFVPKIGKTLAEMRMDEKNQISHRALALRQLREYF
ncbi:MAG: non-canonical purine NTP pyrophosphatase [Turicibacter sp.]|nr:non-canonical purine NTP pyrophosphatase [Turicibacter sp.]